jgi:acyl carrier protein
MSLSTQDALQMIYTSLGEINAERSAEGQLKLIPETKLFGSGGDLDSLEVVNLITRVEALLADRLQSPVVLVDEGAFSNGVHPFRDVSSLATYIVNKVKETG